MAFTVVKNAWCKDVHRGIRFRRVAAPGNGVGAFAIDEYDRLWSWGENIYGNLGLGDPERHYPYSPQDYNNRNIAYVVTPGIATTNTGEVKRDWVKVMQGEKSTIAMDKEGRLWGAGIATAKEAYTYGTCASFGLPDDSGDNLTTWMGGSSPFPLTGSYFFNFTRAAPNFIVKDFMHNYYYTQMIGTDDLFYFMGWEWGSSFSGGSFMGTAEAYWEEPTASPYLTVPIKKILATGNFGSLGGVLTKDNRVLICGDDAGDFDATYDPTIEYVIDVTDNLPDVEIVDLVGDFEGMFVLLSNGDVWGRGSAYFIGLGWYGVDSWDAWVQVPNLSNITKIGVSQISPWAIDFQGYLFTWAAGNSYETGDQCLYGTDRYNEFPTIATRYKRWKDVTFNHFNNAYHGVDVEGRLWAWGTQQYSPQLGMGAARNATDTTYLSLDTDPVSYSCRPLRCDVPQDTLSFHWPRATPTPTPDYYNRS